jgi:hypothetical protein
MTKEELNILFDKYLLRKPSEREWAIHGNKKFSDFENEISNCKERAEILSKYDLKGSKIAFLLTGHIRNNTILNGIMNFCKMYDYDVFIHTWDNIGLKGSETNLNDKINVNAVKNEISKIPNVKKFDIENNKNYINALESKKHYFNFSSPEPFIKSQLYSINKVFSYLEEEVNENKTKYNVVFKFRFDNDLFLFNLNRGIVEDVNNHDIIFVPNIDNGHTHPDNGTSCFSCDKMYYDFNLKDVHIFEHTNIVCDMFAYGSYNSMKKYCSLYNHYDEINEFYFQKNIESGKKHSKHLSLKNDEYKLNGTKGHIDSAYYFYCSYPERMLQLFLKDYMLIQSKNIKLRLKR